MEGEEIGTHQKEELDGSQNQLDGLLGGRNEVLVCHLEERQLLGKVLSPLEDLVPSAAPGGHSPETLIGNEGEEVLARHAGRQYLLVGALDLGLELDPEGVDGISHDVVAPRGQLFPAGTVGRLGGVAGCRPAPDGRLCPVEDAGPIPGLLLGRNGGLRGGGEGGCGRDGAVLDLGAGHFGLEEVPVDDGGSVGGGDYAGDLSGGLDGVGAGGAA